MCLVALATPSLLLYQLLRSAYISYRGNNADPKSNITIDLQFVPRDSDSRTSVNQITESDIEKPKGAPSVKEKDCDEKRMEDEDNVVYSFKDSSDDDDTVAVSERHSGGKARHGGPQSSRPYSRKGRGENGIAFESERNSVDDGGSIESSSREKRDPTTVDRSSGRRTAMDGSSSTRVSQTVSVRSFLYSINIPDVRFFLEGRASRMLAVIESSLNVAVEMIATEPVRNRVLYGEALEPT